MAEILKAASRRKYAILGFILICIALFAGIVTYGLRPLDATGAAAVFAVNKGERFRDVIVALRSAGLIRSTTAAEVYAILDGDAFHIQPGLYKLSPAMSASAILDEIATKGPHEVTVTIPEGDNIYQIDAVLANALVTPAGTFAAYARTNNLEGRLFPDTYQFFTNSSPADIAQRMTDNWNTKAAPLFATDLKNATSDLIMASILEKEVPDPNDQKIVAGILWKRIRAGMPLDVDATVCYAKLIAETSSTDCYPLTQADYTATSPYNTYRYKGLPPAPIGNPGTAALGAAINPQSSPYWYYLSDPATGKTVYAVTLDEQNANRVEYLKSH